jgi:hydroxylamine reductase (hybrid-cluster protein)
MSRAASCITIPRAARHPTQGQNHMNKTLRLTLPALLAAAFALPLAAHAETAKEEIKEQGRDLKANAKSAKNEIKRDAKKTWHGAKSGTKKAGREIKQGAVQSKDAVKEKVN